jgi:hypothetical protein
LKMALTEVLFRAQYDAWIWFFLRYTSTIRYLDLQEENNASSPLGAHAHTHTHTPDATVSQVYYLTFMYGSTSFGRPHAHDQELNNCSNSLWFYLWSGVVAVLLVVVGLARPRPKALLSSRSNGKTRGYYCSCWAPGDGREDGRNMLSRT